jgi:SRSO17 transposase
MQHLLARARWDAGGVRDDVRGYVTGHLADPGAVLVVDETGDLKKGTASAGVARQYTGTAGKVENCQVAVYLSYASAAGHALIDRELYLPASWAGDPARRAAAGIPPHVRFATKPALAGQMIARALDAGVAAARVTGDTVYGAGSRLRKDIEARRVGYVLGVACDHRIITAAGMRRADELAAALPPAAWQRHPAGPGAKGHRTRDWARIPVPGGTPGHRHLLIRRTLASRELSFYRCRAPAPVPLATLARIAGLRWTTEENFQAGKGLTGLDEHQVRTWTSWYRWTTLAMLAAAFLTITTATEHARRPAPADQIPLTRNEIAALFSTLVIEPASARGHRLRWSTWRRRHQRRAKTCHYQRQAAHDP